MPSAVFIVGTVTRSGLAELRRYGGTDDYSRPGSGTAAADLWRGGYLDRIERQVRSGEGPAKRARLYRINEKGRAAIEEADRKLSAKTG